MKPCSLLLKITFEEYSKKSSSSFEYSLIGLSRSSFQEVFMILKYLEPGLKMLISQAHSFKDLSKSIIKFGSIVNSVPSHLHFGQAPFGLLKEKCQALKFFSEPNLENSNLR